MAGLHGTAGSDYFGQISANAQTSFKSPFDLGITLKKGLLLLWTCPDGQWSQFGPFFIAAENHCGPTVECSFLYFFATVHGAEVTTSSLPK